MRGHVGQRQRDRRDEQHAQQRDARAGRVEVGRTVINQAGPSSR